VNYGNGVSCSKTKCSVNWGIITHQAFRVTSGVASG
uniref:Bacteriocin SRCAM 1580 n=1 Tax=Niallia circulans TaxID=1397 RepID=BCN80_NIACI|nr:RecName: Full=Bacteriocin SRCAM 1580 [Niallia circulans]